jgi:cation-transporting ATPase 13A3/4/5
MGGIAMLGFVASFINFVRLGLAWHLIIVRALDLITIVVPPALPATLTIGTNFALTRLRKKQIFCISPQRVNVGGKLDIMCFDKTGTLTEDGLDVLGIRVAQRPANRFSDILSDALSLLPGAAYERDPTIEYDSHKAALYTMATCHSLRVVDGELMGDPLDLKMFEFTGWSFEEGEQKGGDADDEEGGGLSPSIARPPPGMEYDLDDNENPQSASVRRMSDASGNCTQLTELTEVTHRTWCLEVFRIRLPASKSKRHRSKLWFSRLRCLCQRSSGMHERYLQPWQL